MTKIQINNTVRDMTAEEEAQRDADIAAAIVEKEAIDAAAAQKASDKASAKAKLIAGEALTEAEADAVLI